MDARQRRGEVDGFLRTGDHDSLFEAWPGRSIAERGEHGSRALCDALVAEVRRREVTAASRVPAALPDLDFVAFTRAKVEPMVRGLFPRVDVAPVLGLLERSIAFVTPKTVERNIREASYLHTSWQVANIYLASIEAEPLGGDEGRIVGLPVNTTCYISAGYFTADDPFADFVVHEAAHLLHNTRRGTIGLKETRRRERLVDLEYRKRETFAYACEAYSRILGRATRPADRLGLLAKLREGRPPPDDRVDPTECHDILGEAVARRNG